MAIQTDSARKAISNIDLNMIVSGDNPRRHFDENELSELSKSIAQHGVIEPIIVRDKLHAFELICGERRWRAAKMADLVTIPAIILELDDREACEISLIENLLRENLDPIEEAEGYQKLVSMGYKQTEIAERIHRSPEAISNSIRLLKLPEETREYISYGKISPSHGKALLTYLDKPVLFNMQLDRALAGVPTKQLEKITWKQAQELASQGMAEMVPHDKVDISGCRSCDDSIMAEGVRFCLKRECLHQRMAESGEEESEAESSPVFEPETMPKSERISSADNGFSELKARVNVHTAIMSDGEPRVVVMVDSPAEDGTAFLTVADARDLASRLIKTADEINDSIPEPKIADTSDEPQKTAEAVETATGREGIAFTRYLDDNGAIYYIGQGLGSGDDSPWFTLKKKSETAGSHRVKSPALMTRDTREQAQEDLDRYAEKHGFTAEATTNA